MTGQELRKWRESQGLRQKDLANMLNEATGRRYDGAAVGVWERGAREIPPAVRDFLAGGTTPEPHAQEDGEASSLSAPPPSAPGEDLPPAPPDSPRPLGLVTGGGQYAKACEDLWDMFGFTLIASGTAFSKPALANDGRIISGWEDQGGKHAGMKKELGVAYGKLAERNRTFQRIVLALSQESVWAEVTIITSKLAVEMYRNHERYRLIELDQRRARVEAEAQAAHAQAA